MKITYCLVTTNRLKLLQKAIRHHSPHVDRTVVIDGGSTDGSWEWLQSDECKYLNVDAYQHPWCDDPPGHRNLYLKYAGTEGWALCMDDDEYLEEPAIWSIRQIAEDAEKQGASSVGFNAHDIQVNDQGVVWEHKSNYWNSIIFFKLGSNVRFHGKTHVGLRYEPGSFLQSQFRYFHCKSKMEEWLRGARNYWTTATVAGNNTSDPEWREFKRLCGKYGLQYFHDIARLMEAGTVPEELEQWFIDHRDRDNPEQRSYFVSYFVFQHPEKNSGFSNRDYEFKADRKAFKGLKF